MPQNPAVLFDGDDTLWKTQEKYDEAKRRFALLLKNAGIRSNDLIGELDDLDMQRVSTRGFTVDRFIESMLIVYERLSTEQGIVLNPQIESSIHALGDVLRIHPKLYEDSIPALERLSPLANIYLYSAGDRKIQMGKVKELELGKYFQGVFIVPAKNTETLLQLIDEVDLRQDRTWLIGNSLRSDVVPAVTAGLRAIFLRGAIGNTIPAVSPKGKED